MNLFRLPVESELVTDADEEVFHLYTSLSTEDSTSQGFRGLGHVDSRKDTLSITFELQAPVRASDPSLRKAKGKRRDVSCKLIEVELAQDKTALRSRKGDTGSVLWKASVDFSQALLQQHHSRLECSLLDPTELAGARVLELGAGTGLLSIILSPLVHRYTVTDIPDLLPLIRKNLGLNFDNWPIGSNVAVEDLDWVHLHSTAPASRPRFFSPPVDPYDLILVVDCIYNPSLLPALVETIDHYTTPGKTTVLVVMELRQEDVVREFLELWIAKAGCQIHRIGNDFMGKRYAVWSGVKV